MAVIRDARTSGAASRSPRGSVAVAPDDARSRGRCARQAVPSSRSVRGVIVHLAISSLLVAAIAGCGQSEADRLTKQDRDARTAQAHDQAAVSQAERRSATAGLALIGQARIRCRHVRSQIGHSTPADAHRLAVRFARGFTAELQAGMIAACAKELGR